MITFNNSRVLSTDECFHISISRTFSRFPNWLQCHQTTQQWVRSTPQHFLRVIKRHPEIVIQVFYSGFNVRTQRQSWSISQTYPTADQSSPVLIRRICTKEHVRASFSVLWLKDPAPHGCHDCWANIETASAYVQCRFIGTTPSRLNLTGQFSADFCKIRRALSSIWGGSSIHTSSRAIFRGGSVAMTFSTRAVHPLRSQLWRSATIPIIVMMQVLNAVAIRSVGEKRSPFPSLSVGASVSRTDPDRAWIDAQRSFPL